ncbi:MAG TPA: hypothetical protein VE954_27725 [Oligoflexus sp.]|nr:hypothetical protein [Oligoflexus sp.]HYX36914.1 hypothetical protein [Oligoflexus sp.]
MKDNEQTSLIIFPEKLFPSLKPKQAKSFMPFDPAENGLFVRLPFRQA